MLRHCGAYKIMRKKAEFYRTNRCKFHASQTSAVFLTCRVEFVAAVKMHVQLQAKIHGVLLKQFFSWFLRLSLNGFVRFSLKIREKQELLRYNFYFNLTVIKFLNGKLYSDTERGTFDWQNNFNLLQVQFTFRTISNSFRTKQQLAKDNSF